MQLRVKSIESLNQASSETGYELEEPLGRPGGPVESVPAAPGFTFVEEDDVAFSLGLCREVHRIYGDYQESGLRLDDGLLAVLAVTVEMLAVLSRTVTGGMPSMRITVAAAQTREMLAVLFGQDPLNGPLDPVYRQHYRALVEQPARTLAAAVPDGCAAESLDAGPGAGPEAEGGDAGPEAEGGDAGPERRHRSRLRRLFGRR